MGDISRFNKTFVEEVVGEPVDSFQLSSGSDKESGMMGELHSLKVVTKKGEKLDLLLKCLPNRPSQRGLAIGSQLFWVENAFYTGIVPKMEACIKMRDPTVELPFPRIYHAFNDNQNDHLLMEDLRPLGYKMPDKFQCLNLEETLLVISEIARFHAYSYHLLKYEGQVMFETPLAVGPKGEKKLNLLTRDAYEGWKNMGSLVFGPHWEFAKKLMSERDPELGKRLADIHFKDVQEIMMRDRMDKEHNFFRLIVHSDLWITNVLIKYDDKGAPIKAKFVDFQQASVGNVIGELGYFLLTSTTPALRKEHLPRILNTYYDSLMSTLASIKCSPPERFTRGYFIDSFYGTLLPAYLFLTFAIPLQLGDVELREAEENGGGGGGPEDFLNGFKTKLANLLKCEKAISRLEDVTREMLDMGILKSA